MIPRPKTHSRKKITFQDVMLSDARFEGYSRVLLCFFTGTREMKKHELQLTLIVIKCERSRISAVLAEIKDSHVALG